MQGELLSARVDIHVGMSLVHGSVCNRPPAMMPTVPKGCWDCPDKSSSAGQPHTAHMRREEGGIVIRDGARQDRGTTTQER